MLEGIANINIVFVFVFVEIELNLFMLEGLSAWILCTKGSALQICSLRLINSHLMDFQTNLLIKQYKLYKYTRDLALLGGEQAWTPNFYLKSFDMDSA